MPNSDEIRWRQRLKNFGKALGQLKDACDKEEFTELERAELVKVFEFTFELMWKVCKDRLFYEGYDVNTPREVIRQAFEAEYLTEFETETMLDALKKRYLLGHTYEEKTALEAERLIKNRYAPVLYKVHNRLKRKLES